MTGKTVRVDYLARVEGEGSLYVDVKDGDVSDVQFNVFEPPRLFEAFMRGRSYAEAPDITARICGICPIAYQMSAVHAMENAFGVKVDERVRALRRLVYCGEWVESHALHVYMLHAPDFLGYPDAIRMAQDHPDAVKRGLQLKKAGNAIVALLGGREIHPVNVRVGGFYRVPTESELNPLAERLERARDAAAETVEWVSGFTFPDLQREYEFVSLRHPREYPFNEGRLASNRGLDVSVEEFEQHFVEEHVPRTNALHCARREGGAYLVGPLARYNLNFDLLSPAARRAARSAGLQKTCLNPFQSIIVRSVEVLHACEEALRIIGGYRMPGAPASEVHPRAATGYGCTEAPRGMLYHRYRLDDRGLILEANIVPPTSQNQKSIEDDLRQLVSGSLDMAQDELTWRCEQAVRNYDPCISCATHFLRLEVNRR